MIERYGVRSKLNAGAGEGGGGGEPTCVCNNHIHDATSVALGGFSKYISISALCYSHYNEIITPYTAGCGSCGRSQCCTRTMVYRLVAAKPQALIPTPLYCYPFQHLAA